MQFTGTTLERIASGEIDLAFRRWRQPSVLPGSTLRTAAGEIAIHEVERADPDHLTAEDARRAGFATTAALLASLRPGQDRALYRVRLGFATESVGYRLPALPPRRARAGPPLRRAHHATPVARNALTEAPVPDRTNRAAPDATSTPGVGPRGHRLSSPTQPGHTGPDSSQPAADNQPCTAPGSRPSASSARSPASSGPSPQRTQTTSVTRPVGAQPRQKCHASGPAAGSVPGSSQVVATSARAFGFAGTCPQLEHRGGDRRQAGCDGIRWARLSTGCTTAHLPTHVARYVG